MEISIFDVIGPVMIGPSSSHTAGAARLARMARALIDDEFKAVTFHLHGSFAKTYKGHKTNYALVAGVLGMSEDDEAISSSLSIAKERGIIMKFIEADLGNHVHENSVKMEFHIGDNKSKTVSGSSLGGGLIEIFDVNGFETEIHFDAPTVVIQHKDKKGVLKDITEVFADHYLNIAHMKVTRGSKGGVAFCVIETDEEIPEEIDDKFMNIPNVIYAKIIQ